MGTLISGPVEVLAEFLIGPRQHDEHCTGWRWHIFVRDDDKRFEAVKAELRKMREERNA